MTAAGSAKSKLIWQNRKASYDYTIEQSIEAGLVLTGTEVKSLRLGDAHLQDAYIQVKNGVVYLMGGFIAEYRFGNRFNHEPKRTRLLLLHGREILKLWVRLKKSACTIIPLKLYFNNKGRAKIELAVAVGKKQHDKRHSIKKRDQQRLERQHR